MGRFRMCLGRMSGSATPSCFQPCISSVPPSRHWRETTSRRNRPLNDILWAWAAPPKRPAAPPLCSRTTRVQSRPLLRDDKTSHTFLSPDVIGADIAPECAQIWAREGGDDQIFKGVAIGQHIAFRKRGISFDRRAAGRSGRVGHRIQRGGPHQGRWCSLVVTVAAALLVPTGAYAGGHGRLARKANLINCRRCAAAVDPDALSLGFALELER